nr:hypothetical protein [uncultured Flavobacterium sp.]
MLENARLLKRCHTKGLGLERGVTKATMYVLWVILANGGGQELFLNQFSIYLILLDDVNVKDESPAAYLSQGIRLKIFCPLFLYS